MSGEGALKRLKLAAPMRRLRLYPRENPQPRKHRGSTQRRTSITGDRQICIICTISSAIRGSNKRCDTTEANRGPSWSVGPCPSSQCGTVRRCFGSRLLPSVAEQSCWYLHHFHDFFHNRGTTAATRSVTTLDPQSEDRMEGHKNLCFAQRKSREGVINKNCENGTVH